jgi:hypothetical protein
MKKLRRPMLLNNLTVSLTLGDTWLSTVTPPQVAKLREQCCANTSKILDQLEVSRRVDINLYDDIDVIHQLLQLGNVSPWKIIQNWPGYAGLGHECPELGYTPEKAKTFSIFTPNALRFGDENVLLQDDQGDWRCHGWAYSVVQEYVRNLWRDELIEPGSFKKRIEAYRHSIETAPRITGEVSITIDTSKLSQLEDWQKNSIARFLSPAIPNPLETVTVGIAEDKVYSATHLPTEVVIWNFALPTTVTPATQECLFKEAA